jgi:hypothetical protein
VNLPATTLATGDPDAAGAVDAATDEGAAAEADGEVVPTAPVGPAAARGSHAPNAAATAAMRAMPVVGRQGAIEGRMVVEHIGDAPT